MHFKGLLITAGALALSASGFAQLTNVGPFVGAFNDGFETNPDYNHGGNYNFLQSPDNFFTFSSVPGNQSDLWIYNPNAGAGWALDANGLAVTNSGEQGLGLFQNFLTNPIVTLTFATPVADFGGYFASDSTSGHFYLTFFDQNGALIQQSDIYATGNAMTWNGYQTSGSTKIGFVQFSGNLAPVMDDLQANISPVPEPLSMTFLGLGAIGMIVRRRRH